MDLDRACTVIHALADGIDPVTGETFPVDSPYQRGDVVRALHAAERVLTVAAKRSRRQSRLPAQVGRPWDAAEDARLREGFAARRTAAELAAAHARMPGGIRSRLLKLRLISDGEAYP